MRTKKHIIESKWIDPDDAPHLDREWFERAEIRDGDRIIRPARAAGRPKSDAPKQAVNIRLDADLVAYYRATGPRWQSRINQALRKAANLPRRKISA